MSSYLLIQIILNDPAIQLCQIPVKEVEKEELVLQPFPTVEDFLGECSQPYAEENNDAQSV